MQLTLAENIRLYRKQRKMTQEQLAGVLGVTVGAVYKWESGLSVPELNLIVEMADFFDVSVDALLGYRMMDNRLEPVLERIFALCRKMDPAALTEAEKALGRYPHSFRVVHACAEVYLGFGSAAHDPRILRRSLELFGQARVLLPQNEDPRISEASISGDMSAAYLTLGEGEKAVDLMKRHNTDGHFSAQIGAALAVIRPCPEEAVPFLSEGLVNSMTDMLSATIGYVFVYRFRNDWDSALSIVSCCDGMISGLKTGDAPGFMDKTQAEVKLLLAWVLAKSGLRAESEEALRKAADLAARFDATPEYTLRTMRFLENTEHTTAYDIFGATAADSIRFILSLLDDPELAARWKEISREP